MDRDVWQLSREQLLSLIRLQTDIAKHGLNIGDILDLATQRSMALTGADGAVIELAENAHLVYRAAAGIGSKQLGLRIPGANSLSGLCIETGRPLRCDDAIIDTRVDRDSCERIGMRSMVVLPLRHEQHTIGVLKVLSKHRCAFSDEDELLLSMLSEMLAASMFFATHYNFAELFHRATHDQMTGLANRALFLDHLRSALAQAKRHHSLTAVLVIDMNDLKQINDTFGHLSGDAALKEFAQRLQQQSRESDTLARFGGDEFGMVLTSISHPADLTLIVQRMENAVHRPFIFNEQTIDLSGSIGGAVYPDDGDDVDTLLDKADQAMYTHKRAYKDLR